MESQWSIVAVGFACWMSLVAGQARAAAVPPAADRAGIIELSRAFERDILGPDAGRLAAEIQAWWLEVPDLTVTWCSNLLPAEKIGSQNLVAALTVQAVAAAGLYILEHPDRSRDGHDEWLAGLEGVVRAYQRVIVKHRELREPFLDRLADLRAAGKLAEYVDENICGQRWTGHEKPIHE